MRDEYRNVNSAIGKWLKTCFGLSYLTPEEVGDAFAFALMSDCPDACCEVFADYILRNYIVDDCRYPPDLWAEVASDVRTIRTSNAAESWHSKYNHKFSAPSPVIYKVLNVLLRQQEKSYLIINDLTKGHVKQPCKQARETDVIINNARESYENSENSSHTC